MHPSYSRLKLHLVEALKHLRFKF